MAIMMASQAAPLPRGYEWQEDVDRRAAQSKESPFTYQGRDFDPNLVQRGRTLVIGMPTPADWYSLDDQSRWRKKRDFLCERYGDLCFNFLDADTTVPNELARITVAPAHCFTLHEVWNHPNTEVQYRATMVLLEEGLGMELANFLKLKEDFGMSWPAPAPAPVPVPVSTPLPLPVPAPMPVSARVLKPALTPAPVPVPVPVPASISRKRNFEESASELPSIGQACDNNEENARSNKKPKLDERDSTQHPETPTRPELIASLSTHEKQKISCCLFPASPGNPADPAMANTSKPRTRAAGTIHGTLFAKKLQASRQHRYSAHKARRRLCSHYGQASRDAAVLENKYRLKVFYAFGATIQSCTDLAFSHGYSIDKVLNLLALIMRCAEDPLLTTAGFIQSTLIWKWASLYLASVKHRRAMFKSKIQGTGWAAEFEASPVAKKELQQYVQDQAWLSFRSAAGMMEDKIRHCASPK